MLKMSFIKSFIKSIEVIAYLDCSARDPNRVLSYPRNPSSSPHLTDLELSLLEREAAEGSESADNSYQRGISISPAGQVHKSVSFLAVCVNRLLLTLTCFNTAVFFGRSS